MRSIHLLTPALLAVSLLAGCAQRTGVAYIQIENDQSDTGGRAEPVFVDPRVQTVQNEYGRSYLNDGSNIRQTIHVRGPIMIVPAPPAAPQPTQSAPRH
jgi:hypothetical protein